MKNFFNKRNRILIIIAMSLATIISLFLSPLININYDMRQYLPNNSNTKVSLEVLEDEFGQVSMIQMMSSNLEVYEAYGVVEEILEIEVVKSVIWLGTMEADPTQIDLSDQEVIKEFYNDGNLLFTIEFLEDEYSLEVGKAIDEIEEIMNNHNIESNFRGAALGNKSSRELVSSEMLMILVVAVPIAIVILFLASNSWFEPVIILINLGVAIAINMGTNYLMPNVSYITISITSILQLAMSLDYSLFIVHRYYEVRETGLEPLEAAAQSAKDAFGSVAASALTTIFGFLALTIMRYTIGMDVGLSLAKAIFISFVVTILLTPVLLIVFDKILLKLKHKMLIPGFSKITGFLHKRKIIIAIVLLVIGGAAFYGQSKADFIYGDKPNMETESKIYLDQKTIEESFGVFEPIVIMYKAEDKNEAKALTEILLALDEVDSIQSLFTSLDPNIPEDILPDYALEQFKGNYEHYRMIVYLNHTKEDDLSYDLSNKLIDITNQTLTNGGYVVGVPIAVTEIKDTVTSDGIFVQLISIILIALVIGIVLKNPVLPIILVLLIQIAIWINVSVSVISGGILAYIGYLVVSSLQLGATIDYAVLATTRYQELRMTKSPKEAMIEAMNKSAPVIIISAAVLTTAGIIVVFVSSIKIVEEIGLLVARGAFLSGLLVLFILPALLLLFDKLIQKTNISFKKKKKEKIKNENK